MAPISCGTFNFGKPRCDLPLNRSGGHLALINRSELRKVFRPLRLKPRVALPLCPVTAGFWRNRRQRMWNGHNGIRC